MLSKLRVQHYKSLFDTTVDLEPLTVFIGPNGSGKSNICEALAVLSNFLQRVLATTSGYSEIIPFFAESLQAISTNQQNLESKFWHGKFDHLSFEFSTIPEVGNQLSRNSDIELHVSLAYPQKTLSLRAGTHNLNFDVRNTNDLRDILVSKTYPYLDYPIADDLRKVSVYDFSPTSLSNNFNPSANTMDRTGQGIAYALVDILHDNREGFDQLEERFTKLVPNIKRISLPRGINQTFSLELIDKFSEHHIPASDISDGTLRILAFLTALYQKDTPSIICFEEIENGVHPWLLHKMMELLKIVSTEGINGKPVQVLITTHSPVLLNYVEPHQVRAVELDNEGKTQVHALPTDSVRFQKALEAYDGSLGELWFTNVFGGNPA
ncbi:ATP-binding protein [Tumidithrix elongata RA019]|uniref:ATP-binding protein n=1 Tax=Tumidithrix elongata BACA0141 TaxID=2716417 RepID=A0AAW9Q2C7_9CYAN|nr:ATP-binding protein [Tumidithrix elongata RA019]